MDNRGQLLDGYVVGETAAACRTICYRAIGGYTWRSLRTGELNRGKEHVSVAEGTKYEWNHLLLGPWCCDHLSRRYLPNYIELDTEYHGWLRERKVWDQ